MKIIGLISGTSVDGIDAALVEIEGVPPELKVVLHSFVCVPFSFEQRRRIFSLFDPATGTVDHICQMNFALGEWFAAAALRVIAEAGLSPSEVALIASHGQSIYHSVEAGSPVKSTLQIGEPAVIAERTGITTVADFRVADVAAGGGGAPLVSYMDWLLLRHPRNTRAVQNIGGIANVTFLPTDSDPAKVLAFDTGPGNMLIDYAAEQVSGGAQSYDQDGRMAAAGRVNEALLAELMGHTYLAEPIPKTTGREQFGVQFAVRVLERAKALGIAGVDVVATLTTFTAASIADAYQQFLPAMPAEVIVGGGGSSNPTLISLLREALAPATVTTHRALGINDDAKEAMAFAVLAHETIHGRPGNLPSCTGASRQVPLGKIVPGRNFSDICGATKH